MNLRLKIEMPAYPGPRFCVCYAKVKGKPRFRGEMQERNAQGLWRPTAIICTASNFPSAAAQVCAAAQLFCKRLKT